MEWRYIYFLNSETPNIQKNTEIIIVDSLLWINSFFQQSIEIGTTIINKICSHNSNLTNVYLFCHIYLRLFKQKKKRKKTFPKQLTSSLSHLSSIHSIGNYCSKVGGWWGFIYVFILFCRVYIYKHSVVLISWDF